MKSVLIGLALASGLFGQTAGDPTLQALLAEVHQLRLALERSTLIGPRIQIVVERMKLQQDVVSRLSRQADDARREAEAVGPAIGRMTAGLKEIEAAQLTQTDPEARKRSDLEARQVKFEMERMQQIEQQARARLTDLESRIRTEQANLDVLNDKLNQIEKALDRP